MFKIQNLLNRTRNFVSKLNIAIAKHNSRCKSSLRPSLTRLFTLLPATCWLGINILSVDRLKIKSKNSIQQEINMILIKSEKKDVKDLIALTIAAIKEDNLDDAKAHLNEGIEICEQNIFNEFLPRLYDLLSTVAIREGNALQAEEILVRSIEKLTEIGYKETDNEIIQFCLMLARLYQSNGDLEMAGLGFRNCIRLQENKFIIDSEMDEATKMLYLSSLFWYSIFLTDENELDDAKKYLKKALELSRSTPTLEPAQIVVILYNLAELSFRLKEFDDVIKYLVDGLRICVQHLSLDSALPVFMVKLGLVYLVKGTYDAAEYWCSIAQIFAKSSHNPCVENEASLCLKHLKKEKPKD